MKIAFSTHAARPYPSEHRWGGLPSDEEQTALLDWVAAQGFDGIDLGETWIDFDRLDDVEADALLRRVTERGLVVGALNCVNKTLCHPEMLSRHQGALMRALALADRLNCQNVSVSLGQSHLDHEAPSAGWKTSGGSREAAEADYAETGANLQPVATRARELGIKLSIELHHTSIADTSTGLLHVLDKTADPEIGVNPDLVNGQGAYPEPSESWQDALRAFKGRVSIWHVKNAKRIYVPQLKLAVLLEVGLAEGDVDYRWAIHQLAASGFDGWISIENTGPSDPFHLAAEGLQYLRGVIADTSLRTLAVL
jgi:sugar phosphate isomerase/epimerase